MSTDAPVAPTPTPPRRAARVRPPSRPQRWARGCEEARGALEDLATAAGEVADAFNEGNLADAEAALAQMRVAVGEFEDALSTVSEVKDEFEEWRGNLPAGLDESATAEKLDDVIGLEVEATIDIAAAEALVTELREHDGGSPPEDTPSDDGEDEVEPADGENLFDADEAESVLDELESADLPRGFGRD